MTMNNNKITRTLLTRTLTSKSWVIFLEGAVYHEKNHSSTFKFNQISFENKPSRRFQFLNILSCSRDIHLLNRHTTVDL